MTGTQLFVIMAAIYLAPHTSKWVGNGIGAIFIVLAFIWMGRS